MITPYITFSGNCSAALEFYKTAFDSTVKMSQPYGNYVPEGVAVLPDNLCSWILHAEMEICGTRIVAISLCNSSLTTIIAKDGANEKIR